MTLSPVFRSARAIEILRSEGVWNRLEEASIGQGGAIERVRADLPRVLDGRFLMHQSVVDEAVDDAGSLEFVQTFFFLILFRSILQSVGVQRAFLDFYSELNFCIQGTIVAADNLFDGEQKRLLPLRTGSGYRFGSILQLLAFQRLSACVFDRALGHGLVSAGDSERIQREMLSRMADIGALEGSEEAGVEEISDVDSMLERVHRVRGGQLFELSLVAPVVVEPRERRTAILEVGRALSRLGTAFQIVDDVTDLEFDVRHGRQNLLVAQIHQTGTSVEQTALRRIRETEMPFAGIAPFVESAKAVLDRARNETRCSLGELSALGFWWPPRLADELVCAIVGLDGLATMELVSGVRTEASGAQT
jgi:hypothetical protein